MFLAQQYKISSVDCEKLHIFLLSEPKNRRVYIGLCNAVRRGRVSFWTKYASSENYSFSSPVTKKCLTFVLSLKIYYESVKQML